MKKIALEEHCTAPDFDHYQAEIRKRFTRQACDWLDKRLPDFADLRIEAMDNADIELSVLSQTAPGVQAEKDTQTAIRKARQSNDFLAAEIAMRPSRFAGFAHLAMQDPAAAALELRRCVNDFGFKGALINGHTNGVYLDDQMYLPFWEEVQDLGVPIYLHPTPLYDVPHMFKGYEELMGATMGWSFETSTHAMRLIVCGLFDRFPKLKIILGHMGEQIPAMLWRLDSRWKGGTHSRELERSLSQYFIDNFVITVSGVFANAPLLCSIEALGIDNVLFSTDYPYESAQVAADFIDNAPIGEGLKRKICYENAQRILKLK